MKPTPPNGRGYQRNGNASGAQKFALEMRDLCPPHARKLGHFTENWYLAQQDAFAAHMIALGYTQSPPKPAEPMDALVTVAPNARKRA